MKELQIQSKILRYLRAAYPNAWIVKLDTKFTCAGVPDILFIDKETIFFEVKTKRGRLSKIQEYTIKQINKTSAKAYVVRSLDEVKDIL